jgi:FkbH-like protein
MTSTFKLLKQNLKKDYSGLKKIRVAILADAASQLLAQAIRGYGYTQELDLSIWEADYDTVEQTIIDDHSGLYDFKPAFVIIYHTSQKLLNGFYNTTGLKEEYAANKTVYFKRIIHTLTQKHSCNVILLNFPEINDGVFGNFANKTRHSFLFQQRKLNYELMLLAETIPELFIADLSSIQNTIGSVSLIDQKLDIVADNAIELDALPYIAKTATDIICAASGKFKKCLILDLDNTLWGGIIGDDGLEKIEIGDLGIGKAFTRLQQWIRQLKERGIILAVCSKNTEEIAREPFEKHPDMLLHLDDFAVFVANWNNKVDNIKYIQSVLNIGFDAMVFLDDNPFEREMVKAGIPELTVPDLPEDPADYLPFLYSANLFETISFTEEDTKRNDQYREESKRVQLAQSFLNENDFLESLEMTGTFEAVTDFTIPRAAQLSQRSNQFNLRTIRYTEDEIRNMLNKEDTFAFTINLCDRLGDYGLIGLLIVKKTDIHTLFIDTWIMSCRVLKRGVESLTLNELVSWAKARGYKTLTGEYLPTPKNGLVKDHYPSLGFKAENDRYTLSITDYINKKTYITHAFH